MMASNAPADSLFEKASGTSIRVRNPNDPAVKELQTLEERDDAAMEEIDQWIRSNQKFAAEGAGIPSEELNRKILKRLEPVRQGYQDFLEQHPTNAQAHVAYASFLADIGDEEGEVEYLEKAAKLDPTIPAIWNNLANYHGHRGPVTKAFEYYEKAIALEPTEPVYYHNFGTTVYLFRKDAREHYGIDEQQVFDKAFQLYSNSLRLDPKNFELATDVAQTYYGVKPLRTNDALQAWTNAMSLARDDIEREGVHIHFARVNFSIGRFDEARSHLNAVSNSMYADLKARILRNINEKEFGTNAPPAVPGDQTTNAPRRTQ
jgi:tetratricopeptide (TPR) repeat protein